MELQTTLKRVLFDRIFMTILLLETFYLSKVSHTIICKMPYSKDFAFHEQNHRNKKRLN